MVKIRNLDCPFQRSGESPALVCQLEAAFLLADIGPSTRGRLAVIHSDGVVG